METDIDSQCSLNIASKCTSDQGSIQSSLEHFLDEAEKLIELGLLNPLQLIYEDLSEKHKDATVSSAISLIENAPFSSLKKKLIIQRISSTYNASPQDSVSQCELTSSHIEKVIRTQNYSYFVFSLYPDDEGFAVSLKLKEPTNGGSGSRSSQQAVNLTYDDDNILTYLEDGEIPPTLLDLIESCPESSHSELFHQGGIIAEIRDYRHSASRDKFISYFRFLNPSNQTITDDVHRLVSTASGSSILSEEDRVSIEAEIVNATAEPLCLDPSPLVGIVSNLIHSQNDRLKSSYSVRRLAKRCTQRTRNKVKRSETLPSPKELSLCDFLAKKKNRTLPSNRLNKDVNSYFSERTLSEATTVPSIPDIMKFAKKFEQPPLMNDNSLVKVEEFNMEFIEHDRRSHTQVSIFHRQIDDAYFGQLYVDRNRDAQPTSQGGSSCLFRLGSRDSTKKYISQFTEILTEHGKKAVKITHQRPGHPPQVTHTPAFAQAIAAQQRLPVPEQAPAQLPPQPIVPQPAPVVIQQSPVVSQVVPVVAQSTPVSQPAPVVPQQAPVIIIYGVSLLDVVTVASRS
ncbi:Transcription factor SPT20 -like protein [Halotydeus destructor]|nr:Transcription factor SPT20 -like protein [Halotydeus destructor]